MDHPPPDRFNSPVTGRGAKRDAAAETDPVPDLLVDAGVFTRETINVPPRGAEPAPASAVPPPVPETGPGAHGTSKPGPKVRPKPVRLDARRADPEASRHFKRLVTRPETSIAAHLAAEASPAESAIPMSGPLAEAYGKRYGTSNNPEYRPNRLRTVLDGAFTTSTLRWLDALPSGAGRVIIVSLLLLTILLVVAWFFVDSFRSSMSWLVPIKKPEAESGVGALSMDDRRARAEKTVQEFLGAQTVEERLPFVMEPERVKSRMEQFQQRGGTHPAVVSWELGQPQGDRNSAWIPVTFKDAAQRSFTVIVEESVGGCAVDWENFVAYGDVSWKEFCTAHSSEPRAMRVRVKLSGDYRGVYSTEKYLACAIEHREGGPALTGYASRTGRTGQTLADLITGDTWKPLNLYLRFDATSSGNLVIIEDIIRNHWQDESSDWTVR